jgi:hypothetical protein
MNQLIFLIIPEPRLETVLTLDLTLFLSHRRPARWLNSCDTDQMTGAASEPALGGMDPTCHMLQVEADFCADSVELQGLTRRLILAVMGDRDWKRYELLRTVWHQYVIVMLQHCPRLLPIPFDEMPQGRNMELK